jgi:hypothetical protein
MGIRWRYNSHSLAVPVGEGTEPPNTTNGGWKGSCRELASIIGKLSWYRRVYRLHAVTDADIKIADALAKLYEIVTPRTPDGDWNERREIKPEDWEDICACWTARLQQADCPAAQMETRLDSYHLTASDASGDRLGYVFYNRQQNNARDESEEYSAADLRRAARKLDPRLRDAPDDDLKEAENIAAAELYAIYRCVTRALERGSVRLVVHATDNLNALAWWTRGIGHGHVTNAIIRALKQTLQAQNCRLYLVYVSTKLMAADAPSRNEPLKPESVEATLRALRVAWGEAQGMWRVCGEVPKEQRETREDIEEVVMVNSE